MEETPLVSVLMTAHNRQDYIGEAIESVLHSTFSNFELIIVDDGSTDNTVSIARAYENIDKRIRVYINENNLGDYPNRNRAAELARGKYLKYLDSDDSFVQNGLGYCVQMMEDNPAADWGIFSMQNLYEKILITSAEAVSTHFFRKRFLGTGPSGMIIKRHFFEQIGKFTIGYGPASDQYFNLKAASQGNVLLLHKAFFNYRVHASQERNDNHSYIINNYNYLKDSILKLPLQLSTKQKKYLFLKNKRRLLINMFHYFLKERKVSKIYGIIRETQFTLGDALKGVFH